MNGKKDVSPNNNTEPPLKQNAALGNVSLEKPTAGISTLIGKDTKDVIHTFGNPSRKDLSSFGYEWWIYNQYDESYFQIGVQNNKVVTAYAIGNKVDVNPFRIGQPINEIYSKININSSIDFNYKGTSYRFELSEEDINTRPLIRLGNIYAQIYLDKFTGSVSSVRFLDTETLVKQRPYELIYRGQLENQVEPTEANWNLIEAGNKQQIFDITNIIRTRFDLNKLQMDEPTSLVAYLHSKDMFSSDYFSHTSPTKGELKDRLKENNITYKIAGENIAAHYVDGIAAVEGWLNSKGHRESLLNGDFTDIGVGVYREYYTQDFIEK